MVYVEKTHRFVPDSVSNITKYRQELRELGKKKREKCCRLPDGLTMHDLYMMPQEEFDKLERSVPGARDMHPFCLAETFGHRMCKKYNPTTYGSFDDDDEDDDEFIILDSFISVVAKNQNKTLRGIEDNIENCEVTNMPMDMVRNRTWTTTYF